MSDHARVAVLVAWATLSFGCGSPPPTPPVDTGPIDGGSTCAFDRDCDDGNYCNGHETCMPGGDADLHGCRAGSRPCTAPLTCNEMTDACIAGCTDGDHDGHGATSCGGDDCDDTNPHRYPGNLEACDPMNVDEDCDPMTVGARDLDGDGVTSNICCNGSHCGPDCDDLHRDANPTASEVCDGVDNDCDTGVDEGLLIPQYRDADHDGLGDLSRPIPACPGAPGVSPASGDCNDNLASVRPTAPEICDALDNDCDTMIDEETVPIPWYVDADGDGWGIVSSANPSMESCSPLPGRAIRAGDCDDGNAMVSPTAVELCNGRDDDCNGHADYLIAAHDTEDDDQDGFADSNCHATTTDCDDRDPNTATASTPEVCDLFDNDCDGVIDEGTMSSMWYADEDGDGFGDVHSSPIGSCPPIPGRVLDHTDCDDHDRGTHPGAADSCQTRAGTDDDCDGLVDEGGGSLTLYLDMDGDGWGTGTAFMSCIQDAHVASRNGDCDDTNAAVNPNAHDDCTGLPGVDDNCNGAVDETTTTPNFYADGDGDGYGAGTPMMTCHPPAGWVATAGDCDDASASRNPMVPDDCTTAIGVDDDCDVSVDEAVVQRPFYSDADHDGYGTGTAMLACTAPAGSVGANGDCDDANAMRNPAQPDDCTRPFGVDDDCDGMVDEAVTLVTYYVDGDHDGYGTGAPMMACTAPTGTTTMGGDCDDGNATRNPGAPDDCTRPMGVDDDCDGMVDEAATFSMVYRDVDGDGFGAGAAMTTCGVPMGYVSMGGDCDESRAAVNPGARDDCTTMVGVDDDCDAMVDEGATFSMLYRDADGDGYGSGAAVSTCGMPLGYVAAGGDCDESRVAVNPGARDDCTTMIGVDDNCNGTTDEGVVLRSWYADADRDGYGAGSPMMACTAPAGFPASIGGDCDDSNANKNPGRADDCSGVTGVDDDCDGTIDEAVSMTTYYRDADGDGYGNPAVFIGGCTTMAGYVLNNTDCDDMHSTAHPGAIESVASSTCADGIDQDCDTFVDCADSGCTTAPGCGSALTATMGDAQSAAIHAPLAGGLTVRLVDGLGTPLVGRTVALSTTSVTAASGYSLITDAMGQVTFTGVRAPYPLGTETFRVQAIGVPDLLAHATATTPAPGTIFTLLNGRRRTAAMRGGLQAFEASANSELGTLAGASDGTLYLAVDEQIHRIRADGSTQVVAGAGCCGISGLPTGAAVPALTIHTGSTANLPVALDETRNRLYFGVGCGIYFVDIAAGTVNNFMGRNDRCATSGDGGAAIDAGSGSIVGLAVTNSGVVWFSTTGNTPDRNIRFVDTGGRVTHVVDGFQYTYGTIMLDFFPAGATNTVASIPGSDDALITTGCSVSGDPGHVCVLRLDSAGRLTHLAGGPGSNFAEGIDAHLAAFDPWAHVSSRMLPDGSIVIAEENVSLLRRISPAGIINTIAGTRGTIGDTGDDGPSSSALLNHAVYPTVWRSTHIAFWQYSPFAIRAVW